MCVHYFSRIEFRDKSTQLWLWCPKCGAMWMRDGYLADWFSHKNRDRYEINIAFGVDPYGDESYYQDCIDKREALLEVESIIDEGRKGA